MAKGNGGDFHNGVPNKHEGHKGDTKDDVRSSAEARKAQAGELDPNRDAKSALRQGATKPRK